MSKMGTASEILGFLELSGSQILKDLNSYSLLKSKVNLSDILASTRNTFIDQANKSRDPSANLPMIKKHFAIRHEAMTGKASQKFDDLPTQWSDTKREWMSFKSEYMKWAKNLLAHLNRAKLMNKLMWLDVAEIARGLTSISLVNEGAAHVLFDQYDLESLFEHFE